MAERQRCKRDVHGELRLEPMPEIGAGGAHRNVGMVGEEGALLGGRGLGAGGAGDDGDAAGRRGRRSAFRHIRASAAVARRPAGWSGRTARR